MKKEEIQKVTEGPEKKDDRRILLSFTEMEIAFLRKKADETGLSIQEIIRRYVDEKMGIAV